MNFFTLLQGVAYLLCSFCFIIPSYAQHLTGTWGSTSIICDDSLVYSKGLNSSGQLGNGTFANSPQLVTVVNIDKVIAVAGGHSHVIALRADGTVWAWGRNSSGQLGNGTNNTSAIPVMVSGITNAIGIASGRDHCLAVLANGQVMAWGENNSGQLGDGTTTDSNVPVAVSGLSGIVAVAGGHGHSLALRSNGFMVGWGDNGQGQLGDGTQTDRLTPVLVSGISSATAITARRHHSAAVLSNGTAMSWGDNNSGQLGDGTYTTRLTPVPVAGVNDIYDIRASHHTIVALKNDNSIWTWGSNSWGQFGISSPVASSTTPIQVVVPSTLFADIGTGWNHILAMDEAQMVYAWGKNTNQQVHDGVQIQLGYPVKVRQGCGGGMLLPVEWLDFNGFVQDAGNLLAWSTATEQNSAYFQLERSADGLNWEPLTTITAAGNSQSVRHYAFTDLRPLPGVNYYQVAQVDRDGQTDRSPIVTLHTYVEGFDTHTNSNNLTFNELQLNISNPSASDLQIILVNNMGQVVLRESLQLAEGQHQYAVRPGQVPAGIYYLSIAHPAFGQQTHKLIAAGQ